MLFIFQSDQYQHDLYPDTAAPVPAMSAQEWFSGINKPPVLMSMRTGVNYYYIFM